jgi:LysM repeat protein
MALSDLALEEMTMPKNMRMSNQEENTMGQNLLLPSTFERQPERPLPMTPEMSSQDRETKMFNGLGGMQEKDYSSMVSPENARRLEETVKNELLRNPELSDQQKQEAVGNLSGSNILEFMDAMFQEASNMPDEEAGLMLPEQEQEAEMYVDEILGTGPEDSMQPLYDELDKFGMKGKMGSFLIRQNQERLRRQEAGEPSAMERLNQLGDPRDINIAPLGMNHGGPAKQYYNMGGATHTMPDGTVHPGATHEEYEQMLAGGVPMRMNHGGPAMMGLASMGRMEDTELAHVAPGERIVPAEILGQKGNEMLDAAFIRSGLDPMEYTVGSGQGSINPMTGMPEYTSFFKRLLKKVKKVAPALGALVGFRYGGPMGAAIGKTVGGVIKTGDFDFQDALTDFGTGWSLGNLATGFGLQPGKSIFKMGDRGYTIKQGDTTKSIADGYGITEQELIAANPNIVGKAGRGTIMLNIGDELKIPGEGMWGNIATPGQQGGIGGFIQDAGARLSGDSNINLVDQFKDLPMGQKLGVGALGLAALSQTGVFDKEQRGEVPENITQGMQGLENYVNAPLRAYNPQPVLGQNAPLINIPQTQSAVSPFMTTRAPSLSETLADISNNRIGLDFPTFSPG